MTQMLPSGLWRARLLTPSFSKEWSAKPPSTVVARHEQKARIATRRRDLAAGKDWARGTGDCIYSGRVKLQHGFRATIISIHRIIRDARARSAREPATV